MTSLLSYQSRRQLLRIALLACATFGATSPHANDYPVRPIRLIVPVPPGGPTDLAARSLAERLKDELGQPIVIDNRPGASGTLGTALILSAPPDGYTLLVSLPSAQITAPLLMKKPPFDGAEQFTPIGLFARFTPVLLVSAALPVNSFADLVQHAKRNPGKLNYSSTGIGSNPHLMAELLSARTATEFVHIPYKGGAAATQALVSGEVQFVFGELSTALSWIQTGKVKAVAVVSDHRSKLLPGVPTLAEAGLADAPTNPWIGLAGPAHLPAAVVKRLNQALVKATQQPDLQQALAKGGLEASSSSPEALRSLWNEEKRRWGAVIKANNIQAE